MPVGKARSKPHSRSGSTGRGSRFPAEVLAFCKAHGLRRRLDQAIALAQSVLPVIDQPSVELTRDPDTGEEWITLAVVVKGQPADVLIASKRYTAEWVAALAWPDRHRIRLSLDLV